MLALYVGFLALAIALAECWRGTATRWQQGALLIVLLFPLVLILSAQPVPWLLCVAGIAAMYSTLLRWGNGYTGKVVCAAFTIAVLVAFVYFLPLWTGLPMSAAGLRAQMWLQWPGLANLDLTMRPRSFIASMFGPDAIAISLVTLAFILGANSHRVSQ
jgi:hypothetical protein